MILVAQPESARWSFTGLLADYKLWLQIRARHSRKMEGSGQGLNGKSTRGWCSFAQLDDKLVFPGPDLFDFDGVTTRVAPPHGSHDHHFTRKIDFGGRRWRLGALYMILPERLPFICCPYDQAFFFLNAAEGPAGKFTQGKTFGPAEACASDEQGSEECQINGRMHEVIFRCEGRFGNRAGMDQFELL
jgi:hypothetical protein